MSCLSFGLSYRGDSVCKTTLVELESLEIYRTRCLLESAVITLGRTLIPRTSLSRRKGSKKKEQGFRTERGGDVTSTVREIVVYPNWA